MTIWFATLAFAADGLEIQTVEHLGKRYTVARVDLARAELALHGQSVEEAHAWAERSGRTLLFAMNAGMYTPAHTPVGLQIEDGVVVHALTLADGDGNFYLKPNGVFYVDASGPHVVPSERYAAEGVRIATQSGPLLLDAGEIHPAFQPASPNANIRNGIGACRDGTVAMVISGVPVRFHDLATLFRDALGCPDALYLDGLVSAIWAPGRPEPLGRWGGMLVVSVPAATK